MLLFRSSSRRLLRDDDDDDGERLVFLGVSYLMDEDGRLATCSAIGVGVGVTVVIGSELKKIEEKVAIINNSQI